MHTVGTTRVEEQIAEGAGRCNPRDHWTREGGRRAALANALEAVMKAMFAVPAFVEYAHQGAHDVDALAKRVLIDTRRIIDERAKAFRAAAWAAYNNRAKKEVAA